MAGHVLDTSAIVAYLYDEDGSDIAEAVIFDEREPVLLPFIALMEVEYRLLRELGDGASDQISMLLNWPIDVVESNPEWRSLAARIKMPGRISLADAWVAALALMNDAALVHKDPEFESVPGLKELRLPYTQPSRRPR